MPYKDKEEEKAKRKAYREKNREKRNAQSRERYARLKDDPEFKKKQSESVRKSYLKHRDKKIEYSKEYARQNKDEIAKKRKARYEKSLNGEERKPMHSFPKGNIPWNKGKTLSDELKKRISDTQKGKHHSPSTEFKKGQKHKPMSDETKEKIRQAAIKQHSEGRGRTYKIGEYKCSEETKEKLRIINTGKKQSEETKRKVREAHLSNPNMRFKDTKIELKIEAELVKEGIAHKRHAPLCKIALVDFLLTDYNITIECDGCYWHSCPIHYPNHKQHTREKDANKDKVLTENGYKILRFWEHEINDNLDGCMDRILSTIEEVKYGNKQEDIFNMAIGRFENAGIDREMHREPEGVLQEA